MDFGLHVVVPVLSANVPAPQLLHVASPTLTWAAGPYVPTTHSVPVQLDWSLALVYVPGKQSLHDMPSLYLPSTQGHLSAAQSSS